MDVVREDMLIVGVRDAEQRERWRRMTCCANLWKYQGKEEEAINQNPKSICSGKLNIVLTLNWGHVFQKHFLVEENFSRVRGLRSSVLYS